jgi:hypothetical protein
MGLIDLRSVMRSVTIVRNILHATTMFRVVLLQYRDLHLIENLN